MNIFSSQIEKRRKLDASTLSREIKEGAARMGLHYDGAIPQTDNLAIRQVLEALKIVDYELESDDVLPLEQQLHNILQAHGIMTRQLRLTDGWWREASGPMLGRTRSGRLVALLPKWTGRSYRFTDEEGIPQEVTRRQMKDVLMPEAYSFTKALPLQRMTKRQLIAFILSSTDTYSMLYMGFAALIVVLLGMFVPMANKMVFETVIPAGIAADLAPIAGLLVGAAVVIMLTTYIRSQALLSVFEGIIRILIFIGYIRCELSPICR